ncbi:MAG: hypothetical protein ACR2N3_10900 [Pyrinomonadaceae bacterium]
MAVSIALADAPFNIAFKELSQKLKNDLSVASVNLKLNKVERQAVSKSEVRIKGDDAANNLPINFDVKVINFDVKVNVNKQMPIDVAYVFVESANPTAADTEDLLTRDLLNQLNKDYKTENLVVSIDGFDTTQANGRKNFKGTGDVCVGFDWSRISFDVTLDAKTNAATTVKYKVQK